MKLPAPVLVALTAVLLLSTRGQGENWPAWRGPTAQAISSEADLPTAWSRDKNIRKFRCRLRHIDADDSGRSRLHYAS